MSRAIGVLNYKGGTGKTTTVVNLADGLAQRGARVLCVDLDAQGSMATHLGVEYTHSLTHLLLGQVNTEGAGGIFGLAGEGEDIKVHVFPLAQALRMMHDGEIANAHTLIALQWLQLHKQQVQEQWC